MRSSPPYRIVDRFRGTSLLKRELVMEKGFLDKVEDNATIWLFYRDYGDLPYLLKVKVDKHLFRAFVQYWNLVYSYFTFGKVDLVPTMEEHITLLYCLRIQADKTYSRAANVSTFLKRLMSITGMTHPDMKKRVDIFTLSIYGLVIFPKALRHIDDAVSNLFDRLDERVTPIPVEKVSYRIFSDNYSPLKEFVTTPRRDNILKEKWMVILLGIWGAIRYAPLLVLKWYRSRQFIPATQGLAQYEFVYKGDNYKKKVREMSNAWNQTHKMKKFTINPMSTPEYDWWWARNHKARLLKEEFGAGEKDRIVGRGKDAARIRRRRLEVRS
ncbi:hypothetical protein Gohar_003623 [Gossypium harknessii]|uniref:DUF7745 domain-containing protein n=1 Tax=Gossypium harknessii TaxID=34285 RepID=A0A7J9I5Z6_9ROSI|nr:hypothetical protein [Gossypium harknessii]